MTRTDDMLDRYGEVVTATQAGRILSRSSQTVKNMLADGRLRAACAGTMVDVRSIAEYIEQPAQLNERARQMKKGRTWSV